MVDTSTSCKTNTSRLSRGFSAPLQMERSMQSPRMMGSFAYDVALGKQGFFPWFLGPLVGPGGLGTMGLAKGRLTNSRHRFWAHKSATESLVFHGWADPQEKDRLHILDENFLRNLQGYLADCHKADLKPSIFQLVLFSYEASTLATPPFWVPLWFLTGFNHVLACWIAARLLGYVSRSIHLVLQLTFPAPQLQAGLS